jgi:hypothetical protein
VKGVIREKRPIMALQAARPANVEEEAQSRALIL